MEIESELSVIRVMVVDDQKTMRKIIKSLLQKCGINHVIEACNGVEALDTISKLNMPPDVVISDLHMSGMDGLEFCQKVRMTKTEKTKDIKVIILTGDYDELLHEISAQVGAVAVLTKPVTAQVLGNEISNAVGFGKQQVA